MAFRQNKPGAPRLCIVTSEGTIGYVDNPEAPPTEVYGERFIACTLPMITTGDWLVNVSHIVRVRWE